MKKTICVTGVLLLCSGCSSMNNTEAGVLGGGILGAALGTVVGAAAGNPGVGAAIGAGAGAATGGLIGHAEDRAERRQAQAVAHHLKNPPLSLQEVVRLSQDRVSDDIIMQQINTTGSFYQLTGDDISFMKQQGVSDRVVMYMQARRPNVVHVVPPPPPGVVFVEPVPPPVSVGVGIGYYGGRRR